MSYKQLLVLCAAGIFLSNKAMEDPDLRAKLREEIGTGALSSAQALEQIEIICKDNFALKAYAIVWLEDPARRRDSLSFLRNKLKEYSTQSVDATAQEVIDLMFGNLASLYNGVRPDPYYDAAKYGKEKAVIFFRSLYLKPSFWALLKATDRENVTIVKNLLEAGAPVFEESSSAQPTLMHHPLLIAAKKNNPVLVEAMVSFYDLKKKYGSFVTGPWVVAQWAERNIYEYIQVELELHTKPAFDEEHHKTCTKALALLEKHYVHQMYSK